LQVTTFLLIRHATNDWVGNALAGDLPGVHLNEEGREQARELSHRLSRIKIAAVYSSPLERAIETAEPLANLLGSPVERRPRLIEIGLGQWIGRKVSDLESEPLWRRYNSFRSGTRPPGGELMTEVQTRLIDEMEELRSIHRNDTVALVSHGDVIRSGVALYAGLPIDNMLHIEISPASVSVIELGDSGARVVTVNHTRWFSV
jgi:probable phosphomutase (TIGR03848 family)